MRRRYLNRHLIVVVLSCSLAMALSACRQTKTNSPAGGRTFGSPEQAVAALQSAVKGGKIEEVVAIFGPDGQALVDSSDPVTARRNREVFTVAMAEGWRLEDAGTNRKTLVVGHEGWPFPVPLVKNGDAWGFDTAAGREEILARRIGRNELAAIRASRTYVAAQRIYAKRGHDGRKPGVFAAKFQSDPGKHNGLYWPVKAHEKPSPLGDLLADAAAERERAGGAGQQRTPFHGYYFKILTGQGAAAPGGARSYVTNGELTGGFAMVAWPAQYDVTGVMTFIVNQDGIVHEKDLGKGTDATAREMTIYDPDSSWAAVD